MHENHDECACATIEQHMLRGEYLEANKMLATIQFLMDPKGAVTVMNEEYIQRGRDILLHEHDGRTTFERMIMNYFVADNRAEYSQRLLMMFEIYLSRIIVINFDLSDLHLDRISEFDIYFIALIEECATKMQSPGRLQQLAMDIIGKYKGSCRAAYVNRDDFVRSFVYESNKKIPSPFVMSSVAGIILTNAVIIGVYVFAKLGRAAVRYGLGI